MQPRTDNGRLSEITASLMGERQGYISHICLYACTNTVACPVCLCVFQCVAVCLLYVAFKLMHQCTDQYAAVWGSTGSRGMCRSPTHQHIKIRKHTHRHTFTHTYTLRGHYIDLSTIPGNLTDNILKICVCFLSTYRAQSPLIGGPIGWATSQLHSEMR